MSIRALRFGCLTIFIFVIVGVLLLLIATFYLPR